MWNTSSADSYQCGCTDELQETFTPAYVTNTATRELVYLKALSDDSVVDSVYTMCVSRGRPIAARVLTWRPGR